MPSTAHLFQDDDGRLYLYYVDLDGFKIVAQPLTKDGPTTAVIQPTEPWEQTRGQVTEGPWMLTRQGRYYLMYSGSSADGPDYAIGYATATSPTGPFTKYNGNPIAKRGNGVFGPGHHSVITGPDGRLWMAYHQKNRNSATGGHWQSTHSGLMTTVCFTSRPPWDGRAGAGIWSGCA